MGDVASKKVVLATATLREIEDGSAIVQFTVIAGLQGILDAVAGVVAAAALEMVDETTHVSGEKSR